MSQEPIPEHQDEPRSLYYSLTAYDGAGTYLYVAFLGDRRSFAAAATRNILPSVLWPVPALSAC